MAGGVQDSSMTERERRDWVYEEAREAGRSQAVARSLGFISKAMNTRVFSR